VIDVRPHPSGPELGGERPLCFVLMPFGTKVDGNGRRIDFNAVYDPVIGPALGKTRLQGIRADEEKAGGINHKPWWSARTGFGQRAPSWAGGRG
jgi:hypothetical protein